MVGDGFPLYSSSIPRERPPARRYRGDIGNRRETPSEGIGWREGTERDPRSIRRPVPSMERPETACEDSGRVGGETISERPEEVGNSNRPQGNESSERYSISFRLYIQTIREGRVTGWRETLSGVDVPSSGLHPIRRDRVGIGFPQFAR